LEIFFLSTGHLDRSLPETPSSGMYKKQLVFISLSICYYTISKNEMLKYILYKPI